MPDYSKEEWNRLIAHYQQQFISQYAQAKQDASLALVSEHISAEDQTDVKPEEDTFDDIGSLQVRVNTLNNAYPIENAIVTVTRKSANGEEELVRIMTTDSSGTTETIALPTKSRALSLTPGNAVPYTSYTIDVSADGYFRARYENAPVYGGVTAVQNAVLIPLPEGGDNDITLSYTQNK